jgi:predicted nucleotidyltransferase component of viral defense system
MPRLSVDIDLTYIPIEDRITSLKNISDGLNRIKKSLEKTIKGISVTPASKEGHDVKVNLQLNNAHIKIEVNTITRGIIKPLRLLEVKDIVQEEFNKFAAINVVSDAELFGGKICAALDRQHPRDIFDIKILLENEGITKDIRIGFIVFLLSHKRPIHEILNPNLLDQRPTFETQFSGMASSEFTYEYFESTREKLIKEINSVLTENEKIFILNFKDCIFEWDSFPLKVLKDLPAIQWKISNIQKLKENNREKYERHLFKLYEVLNL